MRSTAETVTAGWMRDGFEATPAQRAPTLLRADGALDRERFQDTLVDATSGTSGWPSVIVVRA